MTIATDESGAVLFAPTDYAPLTRRIGAAFVDILVVVLFLVAIGPIAALIWVPREVRQMPNTPERRRLISHHLQPVNSQIVGAWFIGCVLYHLGLRRLRNGTIGYRLMGIRLVDPAGLPPSWWALARRFLLAAPMVPLFGVTYLLCVKTPRRQAFHDRWCGTWMVRKSAEPAGPARLAFQTQLLGTFMLTYIDLEHADPASNDGHPPA